VCSSDEASADDAPASATIRGNRKENDLGFEVCMCVFVFVYM